MMKWINVSLLLTALLFNISFAFSQDILLQIFTKSKVTEKEKKSGIITKYKIQGLEGYYSINLFRNGTFKYEAWENIVGERYSFGVWKIQKGYLILNSTYREGTLPVKVEYINDEPQKARRLKVQNDIYNLKGGKEDFATLKINNDSGICVLFADTCLTKFDKIDSIKVEAGERGCSSKWIKVKDTAYKQLRVTILAYTPFDRYDAFNNRKFKIVNNQIKEVEGFQFFH